MSGRKAAALSSVLALLAAAALAAGALLAYADHTVFRSGAFADRAAATLDAAPVRAAAARRLTDAVVGVRPNLVALRPIIDLGARQVVATAQFRSLLRRAALEAHRSAFDTDRRAVTFGIRDAGVLVADAVRVLRPDAASRIPLGVVTKVARIKGGIDGFMLGLAERADGARRARTIAFALALVLALGPLLVTDSRRASVLRLGVSIAAVGAAVAVASALAPAAIAGAVGPADRDAARAAVDVWLGPVTVWALAAGAAGLVVALVAASVVRPIRLVPAARRAGAALAAPPRNRFERVLRLGAAVAVGAVMVAWPRTVLTTAVAVLGAAIVVVAAAELLALASGPAPAEARPCARPRVSRTAAIAGAALAMVGAVGVAAALSDGETPVARVGRCNGHAELCDRRVDEVAFLGTHNAMAAAGEPGWLFAAQDAGIADQLREGVRGLLIDTHYGIATRRAVATELADDSSTRAKLVAEVGERFVATAERVAGRIGRNPNGTRRVFLCHTLCEVGATRAVDGLRVLHRFLVRNPEEVVLVSIQDDVRPADTVKAIRASGLINEVYLGRAGRPWPTLREMIERDERVVVLAENQTGGVPWIHHQPAVMQETPYRFRTVAELDAATSCRPNRGDTAGSLLLVNHWVDTAPAPRVTIARRVNANGFMMRRLERCRTERGMPPNLIAVDFFRQGDAAQVVDALNGVR